MHVTGNVNFQRNEFLHAICLISSLQCARQKAAEYISKAGSSNFLCSLLVLRPQLVIGLLPLLFGGSFNNVLSLSSPTHPLSLNEYQKTQGGTLGVLSACPNVLLTLEEDLRHEKAYGKGFGPCSYHMGRWHAFLSSRML